MGHTFGRPEFQDPHDAIALKHQGLGARRTARHYQGACRIPVDNIVIVPDAELITLRRCGDAGVPKSKANLLVVELVDIGKGEALTRVIAVRAGGRLVIPLVAHVTRNGGLAKVKRAHGLHVHRARKALARERGARRLVHHHAGQ